MSMPISSMVELGNDFCRRNCSAELRGSGVSARPWTVTFRTRKLLRLLKSERFDRFRVHTCTRSSKESSTLAS